MFDEENLISLAIFLSFCLSVHNTYVLFSQYFFAKFSHYFFSRIFCIIFLQNFRIIFSLTFALVFLRNFRFFAKQIEVKFCEKTESSRIFWSEWNAKIYFFCEKCKIFAKRFFLFTGNLILGTLWQIFTGNKSYNNTASSYQILFIVYICIMFWFYLLKAAKLNKSSTPGGSDSSKTEI